MGVYAGIGRCRKNQKDYGTSGSGRSISVSLDEVKINDN